MKYRFVIIAIIFITLSSCLSSVSQITKTNVISLTVFTTKTAMQNNKTETIKLTNTENRTILPFSVYYLYSNNQDYIYQIYKIEKDDNSIRQLTNELNGIQGFDVSLKDGSLLYLSDKKLYLDKNNGARILIAENIYDAKWCPDGNTIAFWNGKLNIYSIEENKVIESYKIQPNIGNVNIEYSPNSKYIAIKYSTNIYIILNLMTKQRIPLIQPNNDHVSPNSSFTWSENSQYLLFWESVNAGPNYHGLWRFDLNGKEYSPINNNDYGDTAIVTAAPWQDMDNNLYYLFLNNTIDLHNTPFSLVRTKFDGYTDRIAIRPEKFYLYCSLPRPKWSPDGTGLLIPESRTCDIERIIYVPINPNESILTVLPDGRWVYYFMWGP